MARRIALAAQGFADPRPAGPIDRRHLNRVLARTRPAADRFRQRRGAGALHAAVLAARPLSDGAARRRRRQAASGVLFEYWAHEASLPAGRDLAADALAHGARRAATRASMAAWPVGPRARAPDRGDLSRGRADAARSPPPTSTAPRARAAGGAGATTSTPSNGCSGPAASPPIRAAASSGSTICPSACCRRQSSTLPAPEPAGCASRIAAHLGPRARRRHRTATCATISGCRPPT